MVQKKTFLKQKAIKLRKQGFSYSEILKQVPVAKSTLALWLQDVGLSQKQKQRITQKRIFASLKGAECRRKKRLAFTELIFKECKKDIQYISERELWFMGIMLYWAEGSKEKAGRPGSGVRFTNSDSDMIKLFLKWLLDIVKLRQEEIIFNLFVHENHKYRLKEISKFWVDATGFPKENFKSIYFKKNKVNTKRKNTKRDYYGVLRITVKSSSILNRKIAGWVKGVIEYFY